MSTGLAAKGMENPGTSPVNANAGEPWERFKREREQFSYRVSQAHAQYFLG